MPSKCLNKHRYPEISISSISSCDRHRADEQGVQCTIVVHGQAFIPCQNCTNPMTNPSFTRERRFREIRFISTRFEASTDLHEHGCCASDIVNRTTFANPLLPSLTRLTGARDGDACAPILHTCTNVLLRPIRCIYAYMCHLGECYMCV
jgi:hypothetical protein